MSQVTVINQQNRPAGTYNSPAVPVPTDNPQIVIVGVMNQADAVDSGNTFTLKVQASYDGGSTWRDFATFPWEGGLQKDGVTPNWPNIQVQFSFTNPPSHVRGTLVLTKPLSLGASITVG